MAEKKPEKKEKATTKSAEEYTAICDFTTMGVEGGNIAISKGDKIILTAISKDWIPVSMRYLKKNS